MTEKRYRTLVPENFRKPRAELERALVAAQQGMLKYEALAHAVGRMLRALDGHNLARIRWHETATPNDKNYAAWAWTWGRTFEKYRAQAEKMLEEGGAECRPGGDSVVTETPEKAAKAHD